MIERIKKFLFLIFIMFFLKACDGEMLLRTAPCKDGTSRQGGDCAELKTGDDAATECKDPDLNNLQKGEVMTMCDGSSGEGKLVLKSEIPVCTKDGEQDCVNKSKFKAVNIESLSSSDIKNGKVIAGVTGNLRAFKKCRNYSALSTFDSSYPPTIMGWTFSTFLPTSVNTASDQITFPNYHGLITNSPVRFSTTNTLPAPLVAGTTYYAIYVTASIFQLATTPNGAAIDITTQGTGTHTARDVPDGVAQYFDSIDDNNNGLASSPTDNPWSSDEYLCNSSNFVNVTSSSAPLLPSGLTPPTGNRAFTQIWQDQITGLYFTNNLYMTGGSRTWADAVQTCEYINGGTAGNGWRLPTQKELLQLYVHGISKLPVVGGFTTSNWSSSGITHAWPVSLTGGFSNTVVRTTNTNAVLCVR